MTKAFFRYERGPKGWVPKLYWGEAPKDLKPSEGDPPFHSPTQEVTEILKNKGLFTKRDAFIFLCDHITPPSSIIQKD